MTSKPWIKIEVVGASKNVALDALIADLEAILAKDRRPAFSNWTSVEDDFKAAIDKHKRGEG